jgi:hypothetical protein
MGLLENPADKRACERRTSRYETAASVARYTPKESVSGWSGMDDISGVTVRPWESDERHQALDPLRRAPVLY